MSISVNNSTSQTGNPNFKAKWDKTAQGTPYYKTNSGTTAGAVMAIPAALTWLNNRNLPTSEAEVLEKTNKIKDMFTKSLNKEDAKIFSEGFENGLNMASDDIKKAIEANKKQKKLAVPFAILAAAMTLGCGVIVDNIRNQKAQETADLTRKVGIKNAVLQGENVSVSNKGRTYFDSNVGSKYGLLLGAACGVTDAFMKQAGKNIKTTAVISNALLFGISGWIMGKIADSNSNKAARKNA